MICHKEKSIRNISTANRDSQYCSRWVTIRSDLYLEQDSWGTSLDTNLVSTWLRQLWYAKMSRFISSNMSQNSGVFSFTIFENIWNNIYWIMAALYPKIAILGSFNLFQYGGNFGHFPSHRSHIW
jgi:hypothetical protein